MFAIMSQDIEPVPQTAPVSVGPSATQQQTTMISASGAAPMQTVAMSAATETQAKHAPTPTMPFNAPAPLTPTQGYEPTTFEYGPAGSAHTPSMITTLPRAASGHSNPNSFRRTSMPDPMRHTVASFEDAATLSGYGQPRPQRSGVGHPLPPLPPDGRRAIPEVHAVDGQRSGIDWIVPVEDKLYREKTVGERLHATLAKAVIERDKYALKARMTGYALNIAIGLQVLLGSLTTALSAATTGRSTQIATVVLGGLATLVASYLARARGSNEPELSITRVKDLEQFIRECEAFQMDRGHISGDKYDHQLETFRRKFEELLGNANGERKLSPPV